MKNSKIKISRNVNDKKHDQKKPYKIQTLDDLFLDELKDIYWAEKALVKAIPKMMKNVASKDLSIALDGHLKETETQVKRLEEVFSLLNKKPMAEKCEAMQGLIEEAEQSMARTKEGALLDAAIICAAQKVEHYEIASYGTLYSFAQTLGADDIADLLKESLDEEKGANEALSHIAESHINADATEDVEENSLEVTEAELR